MNAALAALEEAGFAPELEAHDRGLLQEVLAGGEATLSGHRQVLHGSPHGNNILTDEGRVLFIDFETVCHGPVEWDLAHLPAAVAANYPGGFDGGLLGRCRLLVSAVVAAWCWDAVDRGPDMRDHAAHHLEVVRGASGSRR